MTGQNGTAGLVLTERQQALLSQEPPEDEPDPPESERPQRANFHPSACTRLQLSISSAVVAPWVWG